METWGLAIIFILFLSWTHVFLLCGYIYLCLPRNQRYRGNKPAFCLFLSFFFSIIVLNSENTYSPKRKEALSRCLWIHCRTLIELGAHFIVKSVSIKKNVTWGREECNGRAVGVWMCNSVESGSVVHINGSIWQNFVKQEANRSKLIIIYAWD